MTFTGEDLSYGMDRPPNRLARWFDRRAANQRAIDTLTVDRDRWKLLANRTEVERAQLEHKHNETIELLVKTRNDLRSANARITKLERYLEGYLNEADAHAAGMVKRINASTLGQADKAWLIGVPVDEVAAG